ncbi:MAG TPA: SDR family oxidoreductase [Devosia sp.]|nr:SDR family oxidoreductase [Devosia sp.]
MKVALVTGASRGLGAEIAVQLAQAGWKTAVNYAHDDDGAAATVDRIETAGGTACRSRFDITDESAVRAGMMSVASELGSIDLIVNNATGPQGAVPLPEQTWDLYQRHLDFFVKAPFLLLKEVLADWCSRKSGRIINIGSEVTKLGSPFDAHYVAAKAAMIGLTRSWATELGPHGITVNMVSPGWTPVARHVGTPQSEYDAHVAKLPLGRMGLPGDVAGVVAFVASPAADYITGQELCVNGGRTYS